MLKKFLLICLIFFTGTFSMAQEKVYRLNAEISVINKVPKEFYGTWRVKSSLLSTTNEQIFKPTSVDLWNLSRTGNVITLDNPFSGAKASITVKEVSNKVIKFKKIGDYYGKKLSDVVQLKLEGETFEGENYLILETLSDIDKSVIKTDKAIYKLVGKKISGSSIK